MELYSPGRRKQLHLFVIYHISWNTAPFVLYFPYNQGNTDPFFVIFHTHRRIQLHLLNKWSCIPCVWKIANKWSCIPLVVWKITIKWSCIPWCMVNNKQTKLYSPVCMLNNKQMKLYSCEEKNTASFV
jgi:hypothetical protein